MHVFSPSLSPSHTNTNKQSWRCVSTLTYVVNGTSTELSAKKFSSKVFEVSDEVRPQMQYIVAGESVTFFYNHSPCSKKSTFNCCPKTTRTRTNDENLKWLPPAACTYSKCDSSFINTQSQTVSLIFYGITKQAWPMPHKHMYRVLANDCGLYWHK